MAVYEVFSHCVLVKHKSTICSNATLFILVTSLLTVIGPLLLVYRSSGFWLRTATYREQPQVLFKHMYLLIAETNKLDQSIICTTYPNLLALVKEDRCILVKSREYDNNDDGKYDELQTEFSLQVQPSETIHSVKLLLIFDYRLHVMSTLQMEALSYIHYSSSLPGSRFDVIADLKLVQKEPLHSHGKDLRYNMSIINSESLLTKQFDLREILKNYAQRNVSTITKNFYPLWTAGYPTDMPFVINVVINYPEETILYKPRFWQVIKWAWIQYFSVLIIFLYIFKLIKAYVFQNQLVSSIKIIPWKKVM